MLLQSRSALVLLTLSLLATGCRKSKDKDINVDASGVFEKLPDVTPAEEDWPWWRGPNRNGIAITTDAPIEFGPEKNVVFKIAIPGRGHSSPTIYGDKLFLTTCDDKAKVQSVLCFDKHTGDRLWKTDLHEGNLPSGRLMGNSHASATVACDGERVFAVFLNDGKIWLTALDLEGEELWETQVGHMELQFGCAASPLIYKSFVIIAADHKGGGYLAALHRKTGKIHWRKKRPKHPSYCSPVIAHLDGEDQLLISGTRQVASYDPDTGEQNWSVDAITQTTVGSPVWNETTIFASGGADRDDGWPNETVAIKSDGSGILWKNKTKIYVPSMILHEGHLYGVTDGGIAYCWDADSGKEQWKGRLRGDYWGSPVLIGEHIYIGSKQGKLNIFQATPEKFTLIASHQLCDEIYATPVPSEGRLYVRTIHNNETREERLYCFGPE